MSPRRCATNDTLYSADITGNPGNCSYPHRHDVVDADSLKAAVCHDYVCAEYKYLSLIHI